MTHQWFKYSKWFSSGHVGKSQRYASSRIILSSSKWNNRCSRNPLVFGPHRHPNDHKSGFKRRIDYCGIFYFFIKYLKIKQEHYENAIKPVFIKWADLTIQPLDYHYSEIFDSLFIPVVDTIRAIDNDGMAASHLEGYKEYDLLLLITYVVNQYNTYIREFVRDITSRIQSDLATLVPTISPYSYKQAQSSNYYHLSNILRYLWDKFWESESEAQLEIKGKILMQIPGERSISLSDSEMELQKLKEHIEKITDEIVYTLLSFEIERNYISQRVNEFTKRIYLIERDIRWNKGFSGRCGWELNFWGRWYFFNRLIWRHDPIVNTSLEDPIS